MENVSKIMALGMVVALSCAPISFAAVTIDLTTGGVGATLDGTDVGGDSGSILDSLTAAQFTLTTEALTGIGGAPVVLNATASRLGIDSAGGGDNASEFDEGESWSFSTSNTIKLDGFDANGLSPTDTFLVQSDAWVGATVSPGNGGVTFDSPSGAFRISTSSSLDKGDLWGLSDSIDVLQDGIITITFDDTTVSGTDGGAGELQSLTFTAIGAPEPSSLALLGFGAAVIGARRKKKALQS